MRADLLQSSSGGGELENAYDNTGSLVFTKKEYRVFSGSEISEGKRSGGLLVGTALQKQGLNRIIDEYPDCVVENFYLNSAGGFKFYGKSYWNSLRGYSNARVTVVCERKKVKAVYDRVGKKIYPAGINRVFTGAEISDGKRKGGEFIGSSSSRPGLNKLTKGLTDYIIEDLPLNKVGGLELGGKSVCWNMKGYENALVTVDVRQGEVAGIYDRDGNKVFPVMKQDLYVGAEMVNGIRVGGTFAGTAYYKPALMALVRENPDCIVENVPLTIKGGLYFDGSFLWKAKSGYEHANVTLEFMDGSIVAVYDEKGEILFQEDDYAAWNAYKRLWDDGDLYKIMCLFGPEGANRLLCRFFKELKPKDLIKYTSHFLDSLPRMEKKRIRERSKSLAGAGDLLGAMGQIRLFSEERALKDREIAVEEIKKLVYPRVVRDFRFLEVIKAESDNPEISPFLKKCYKAVYDHYEKLKGLELSGVQSATKLKFYQKIGIKFILDKKKVILADEPGIGKTVQALVASMNAYGGKGARKVLILCPQIAKTDIWERQIKKHLRGEQETIVIKKRKTLDITRRMKEAKEAKFIIVNYELIRGPDGKCLRDKIKALGVDFIIVDEVHRMRNDSQITKAVASFEVPYKVGMSGTPLVGRDTGKLFNLFYWLYPERYPDRQTFNAVFKGKNGYKKLRDEMKAFVLRRYFSDVLMEMPGLDIEIKIVDMPDKQKELYKGIEARVYAEEDIPVISQLALLKHAAISSGLVRKITITDISTGVKREVLPGAHRLVIGDVTHRIVWGGNGTVKVISRGKDMSVEEREMYPGEIMEFAGKKYKLDIEKRRHSSGKMKELDAIVRNVINEKKEKIVIFSGSVDMVKTLETRYRKLGYDVESMYGSVSESRREKIIDDFNNKKGPRIFVCTYQTGGEAIDLTGACTGLIIDEPWTVQERDQIMRRLYRLGQKKEVKIYILQSAGTIDERIDRLLIEGKQLQDMLLDSPDIEYDIEDTVETLKQVFLERKDEAKKNVSGKAPYGILSENSDICSVSVVKEGPLRVSFRKKVFSARLQKNDGDMVELTSFEELLRQRKELTATSVGLLRRFFLQRFSAEENESVAVKEKVLWWICRDILKGFGDIDYHGRIEPVVLMGSRVLKNVIYNPACEKEKLLNEIDSSSRDLYDETMYFLDTENILKFFSMIGMIPQTYYYKGKLLKYSSPIRMDFERGGIRFYNRRKVENIAPGWKRLEKEIFQGYKGFKRDSESVRPLKRSEEIQLARQLEIGNMAAEEPLVGSHLKEIMPAARRIKRYMIRLFGKPLAGSIEEDELCDMGRAALVDLVRRYAELGAYERYDLKSYLKKRLNPRMYSYGYKRVAELKELTADAGLYRDDSRSVTLVSQESVNAVGIQHMEGEETKEVMRTLLRQRGFTEKDIELIELYVYAGYTEKDLKDLFTAEDQGSDELSESSPEEIIERFIALMRGIGREQFEKILTGGLIARGDKKALMEELMEQVTDPSGRLITANILEDNIFNDQAAALRKMTARAGLNFFDRLAVIDAINDLLEYQKVAFDAIVKNAPLEWLLGFSTGAPGVRAYLKKILPGQVLGYSREALSTLEGTALMEYLLHEPLCARVGHYKARRIQEELFKDSNYSGKAQGVVGEALRGIIRKLSDENIFPDLAEPSDMESSDKIDRRTGRRIKDGHYINRTFSRYLLSVSGAFSRGKGNAVTEGPKFNIVIDTTLLPREDEELLRSMTEFAYVILSTAQLDNVRYVFTRGAIPLVEEDLTNGLKDDIARAPSEEKVLRILKGALRDIAGVSGITSGELDQIIMRRVSERRSRDDEDSIEMPVITSELASWMNARGQLIGENQYPVVMSRGRRNDNGSVPILDYESAVKVALAKGVLAFSRMRINKGEEGAREEYENLKKNILLRMNDLYSAVRGEDNPVEITEHILELMVGEEEIHRLNRAIDLYLPPVTVVPVRDLKLYHDRICLYLRAA